MLRKLKILYKIGTALKKIFGWLNRWTAALIGSGTAIWELLGNAPDLLVIMAGAMLVAIGLAKNI